MPAAGLRVTSAATAGASTLDLEHYLDVLAQKPGAFAGSKPLAQWRAAGRWPPCYDELWTRLLTRHGKQNGTRAMVAVVALGREFGHDALRTAIGTAVSLGACDVAAVRYLLTEAGCTKPCRARSMLASWLATIGRCRRWPSTMCCCLAPAQARHDG